MAVAWKFCIVILLWSFAVQADVAHLGYSRYRGQRLRLQRLEAEPVPYPAAGYRPNREFSLPRDQPLFPLANQHSDRPFGNSDFNNLGETQRPQLTYGSPQPEPRFRPKNRPQQFNNGDEAQEQVFVVQYQQRQPTKNENNNFQRPQQAENSLNNGFNNFAETQQLGETQRPQVTYGSPQPEPRFRPQNRPQNFNNGDQAQEQVLAIQYQQRQATQNENNNFQRPQQAENSLNNGFNNFAETQQLELEEQKKIFSQQNGFNNLAEPQQPDSLYGAPNTQEQEAQSARLRQQLAARLQQAQRYEQIQQQQEESQRYRKAQSQILQSQQQHQQQFLNAPQTLYSAPSQQLQQSQLQAESQTSRVIARKPARLTDNREETDLEADVKTAESEEIETTTKTENKKPVLPPSVSTTNASTPVVANTGAVSYYPAGAVSFVQPFNGAYIASANYQALQPISAAYTVGSPYLPQQYALAAAPAAPLGQLQAW